MAYKIAIGADHKGYELKQHIKSEFTNIIWHDVGCFNNDRTDYPIFAIKAVNLVLNKEAEFGILICGSGVGMVIAANRFSKIYAGLVCSPEMAKAAKEDDNVNMLVLASDYINSGIAIECINSWLDAKFKGDRYQQRLNMIDGKD